MMRFAFDERRAAQAASILLDRAGGSMDYLKLVKLLYLADRASLIETEVPITDDHYASMKHGPTPCQVLELILQEQPREESIWHRYIKREHFVAHLCGPVEWEQLSESSVELLNDTYETYGKLRASQVVSQTQALPEWRDPEKSPIPIDPADILRYAGYSEYAIELVTDNAEAIYQMHTQLVRAG
ncbi:MAG: Panacea domain-containing protein [Chloroflexota bacterium]|nr:Panacea domain-containing protein [Chloroflexota bacterium]MDE2894349.1 Panacea domain-containing protein [Chloroflexota bacterium]